MPEANSCMSLVFYQFAKVETLELENNNKVITVFAYIPAQTL